jgi:hypothetical protein
MLEVPVCRNVIGDLVEPDGDKIDEFDRVKQ